MMDWSVRPNMIFAVAFDYSPLDRAQKKQVLDIVTKELLTPKGLRTLSPKSGGYNPNYVGPQDSERLRIPPRRLAVALWALYGSVPAYISKIVVFRL